MSILDALDEACALLRAGGDASAIASHWGAVDDSSTRLLVVRRAGHPWERVQILVDESGRVDEVAFDLRPGAEIPISMLTAAYGESEEEDAVDGPIVLWFRSPDGACRVSAMVRRSSSTDRTSRRLSVIAPATR